MILLALILAAETPAVVVGPGAQSCPLAMSPEHRFRSFDYIAGVWTGMNIASNKPVGHTVTVQGIIKDVAEACLAHPELRLADAVLGVHMRYEREKR